MQRVRGGGWMGSSLKDECECKRPRGRTKLSAAEEQKEGPGTLRV